MKSSTIPDAGAIDTGPSAPSEIFLNENKGPIEFWVHPNYPSRTVIISAIKAHGGVVTDDFESAHFAVLSEEMSLTQWEAGKWSDSNIIAISGTWIAECLNNGAQISNEDYVIWSPRSHEPSAFHVANSGDPKPGTRTQDEYFFLWACEKLMNENPHIQWAGIYRWCAKKKHGEKQG
ncbi:hypothetical protein BS47DRAFT_335020 [Hydnum rufescens UP504]|uniref:BRCT domain-containing protein n=1 Tax=Hydnum rufescens UP504 TaxID=1448309 RepID=A0A9P6B6I3_9AGAM|nr:hypothetical protein BS47DRAFT_335020 [Hydnum rufescens UP504]